MAGDPVPWWIGVGSQYLTTTGGTMSDYRSAQLMPGSPMVVRNTECATSDAHCIASSRERLAKAVDVYRELLEELASRLAPVLSPNGPPQNGAADLKAPRATMSPMAEQLSALAFHVQESNDVLRNLIGRLKV
jgi:hypothetical protein